VTDPVIPEFRTTNQQKTFIFFSETFVMIGIMKTAAETITKITHTPRKRKRFYIGSEWFSWKVT